MKDAPEPMIRKTVALSTSMWEEIRAFGVSEHIATETEALRRLLRSALKQTKDGR